MIRQPAVAGQFYPGGAAALTRDLDTYVGDAAEARPAIGIVSPHAGYVYSGAVAGCVFGAVTVPRRVLILAPNHTGLGGTFSLWPEGSWATPLGEVAVDADLTAALGACSLVSTETFAHLREHSAEVQVPFVRHRNPEASIAAVVIASRSPSELREFGAAVAEAVRRAGEVLIVASSDMTHYEPHEEAIRKDKQAIDRICALDPEGLLRTVAEHQISMCGAAPTAAMLFAANALGAREASLARYRTSGDASGDYTQVVGYAGVVVR
jgi:AmmeMemoRadiSam system protein B